MYQVLTSLDFIIFLSILLFSFHMEYCRELRYMCYNAGHSCYGRVIMTPVDTYLSVLLVLGQSSPVHAVLYLLFVLSLPPRP